MLKQEVGALREQLMAVSKALEAALQRERRYVAWMEGRDAQVHALFQQLNSVQRQYWNAPEVAELQDATLGRWRRLQEVERLSAGSAPRRADAFGVRRPTPATSKPTRRRVRAAGKKR